MGLLNFFTKRKFGKIIKSVNDSCLELYCNICKYLDDNSQEKDVNHLEVLSFSILLLTDLYWLSIEKKIINEHDKNIYKSLCISAQNDVIDEFLKGIDNFKKYMESKEDIYKFVTIRSGQYKNIFYQKTTLDEDIMHELTYTFLNNSFKEPLSENTMHLVPHLSFLLVESYNEYLKRFDRIL